MARTRALKSPLACLLTVALAACGGGTVDSTTTAPTPTTPASTVPIPSPSATAAALGWQPIADPSPFDSADVPDGVAGAGGMFLVGSVFGSAGPTAAAWTSTDGRVWVRLDPGTKFKDKVFLHVARVGDRFVSSSATCDPGGGECGGDETWTTADGKTWVPGDFPDLTGPLCCGVTDLASAGPGVVATSSATGPHLGSIVTSPDGLKWTAQPPAASFANASLNAAVGKGAEIVVVGARDDGTFGAWRSRDAVTWIESPRAVPAEGDVRDLVVGGPGLVAVGRDGSDAAVWTSTDGATWKRVPATTDLAGAAMNRVTLVGTTLVAIGKRGSGGAIWTSPDGLAWTREDDGATFDGYQLSVIVALDRTATVIGRSVTLKTQLWNRSY